MILSSYSTTRLEDVATAVPFGRLWFQLYFFKDRKLTAELVRRAKRAGYKAIVVTADTPYAGKKLNDQRHGGFNPQIG